MPTFETNVPPSARQPSDKADNASATEFRPRRREQWSAAEASQTFDPAPIPPDVKKTIDQRVNEMIRQSRGPDETFFALREWWNTLRRIFFGIPALVRDLLHRNQEEDEDDESSENSETDAPAEKKTGDKPKSRQDDGQKPRQQHRGRRGGRRHNNRGHGGRQQNKPRNDSSDGD